MNKNEYPDKFISTLRELTLGVIRHEPEGPFRSNAALATLALDLDGQLKVIAKDAGDIKLKQEVAAELFTNLLSAKTELEKICRTHGINLPHEGEVYYES